MANFPLKTHIFLTPLHSTQNLKMFPLHCIPQMLFADSLNVKRIIRVKSFFSKIYRLGTIHP